MTAVGGTHVCLREVRGEAIWQQLREHGVTHLSAAPTVVSALLNASAAGPLARPVTVSAGGAPPSPTTIAELERLGFKLVHLYGLTETYGQFPSASLSRTGLTCRPASAPRCRPARAWA